MRRASFNRKGAKGAKAGHFVPQSTQRTQSFFFRHEGHEEHEAEPFLSPGHLVIWSHM
jgi:hypothetical protein